MKQVGGHSDEVSVVRCLLRVFDALGFGSILIGDGRRVLHVSQQAEQHLGAGLTIQSGCLAATDTGSDQILQEMLATGCAGQDDPRDALGLHRADSRPLILRIVPLDESIRSISDDARLLAVLIDPEYCPQPPAILLQQVFGLTRREGEVAIRLMCGDTLQEIANKTGIGLGTVRTQAKAALAKTETKRQAELVGLLTRLAVISGQAR